MLEKLWSKENTHPLLVGMQTCATTLEISVQFLRKLEINLPQDQQLHSWEYIQKMLNHTTRAFVQLCS